MAFAELSITSNFSFLTGGSHPQEYALRAIALGLPAFAIADRNSVAGLVRAHHELKEAARDGTAVPRLLPAARLVLADGLEITALAREPRRLGAALPAADPRRESRAEGRVPALARRPDGPRRAAPAAAPSRRAARPARLAAGGARLRRGAPPRPPRRQPALRRPGRGADRARRAGRREPRAAAGRLGRADHAPCQPPAARRRADLHPRGAAHRQDRPRRARQRRAAVAVGGRDAAAVRTARGRGAPGRRDRGGLRLRARRVGLRVPAGDLGRRGPAGAAGAADRRGAALPLSGRGARGAAGAGRQGAGADRPQGLRAVLPDRARRGGLRAEPGHPLPGARVGGELDRLLGARHHLDVARGRHHGVRALRFGRPRRAARHRRRLRARAPRGGDPVHLPPLRPRARRHLRHRHPLPRQAGDPRGRRRHGAVARHGGGALLARSGAGAAAGCRASGWSSSGSTPTSRGSG